uniref:Uncharacterized protein n=1 Tax=Siphoviridae sp. cteHV32 TaxID=2825588 RepID=A0A8S5QH16_9CAUD|nr:MAG TPA: Protein of unknown function (DUF1398) [Siphoviridae sp. cteHV32]DAI48213.1 MAG TPA: Protein of unknown function (DUF1398) [Caudoviricetes sp.]DAZ11785.1 MAG TPA: Protein of unknown function (DUF1398) [Caudoviricetes sp.]
MKSGDTSFPDFCIRITRKLISVNGGCIYER